MKIALKAILTLLLLQVVVSLYAQEFEASSQPLLINFNLKDSNAPDVFLSYPNKGTLNANGKIDVEIRIFDLSGIDEVIINNEMRFVGDSKDSVVLKEEFLADEEISVKATDNYHNAKDKSFTVKLQSTEKNAKNIHKYYALLIGVEKYTDYMIPALSDPIKDATLLKNVLVKNYSFEESDVTLLKNPTYMQMDLAFAELMEKITPQDHLIIFYAGHGFYDTKNDIGYWLPSDAVQNGKAMFFRNSTLVENIRAINSKHTLLIADACFSGGIFKTRGPSNNASPNISYMMSHPSRKAITSGALTTVPDKSIFMKYLLKILEENENDYLPSEDLYYEVRQSMRFNSPTVPLFGEIQNAGDEGGNFVLVRRKK